MARGVASTPIAAPAAPEALLREEGFFWGRHGRGFVAWGEAARIDVGVGPDRFARASLALERAFAGLGSEAGAPPLAYGSFTFDPDEEGSWLVVPRHVLRFDRDEAVMTSIGEAPARFPTSAVTNGHTDVRYGGSSLADHLWLERVAEASAAIERGGLDKVVLARDVHIWSRRGFNERMLLARLGERFPQCYTFACRGLIGASPELLVARDGEIVRSLTLAGSARRGEGAADLRLGDDLLSSSKDRREHELAVRSVTDVLEVHCKDVVTEGPEVLRLANVQHLATRVNGRVEETTSALDLAGHLHPTAAVGGTPTAAALDLIRRREEMSRGRYAGPVGWVDARGDGEWAIALRCAYLDGGRGRLFAGAGIVEGSEPEAELEETRLKLRAMMSVLGDDRPS